MLDGSISSLFCSRIIVKGILLVSFVSQPAFGLSYADGIDAIPKHMEQEWVCRYFNSINEETPIEEVVDFLVSLKASFLSKGYRMPSLSEFCLHIRNELFKKGVEIDDEEIEIVYNEISKRESALIQTVSFRKAIANDSISIEFIKKKDRHKKGGKINSKTIFGFVKILTGSLLCLVPVPIVQGAGALLVGNGVNDCIDGAREQADDNEREHKVEQGQPPNMPAEYQNQLLDEKK